MRGRALVLFCIYDRWWKLISEMEMEMENIWIISNMGERRYYTSSPSPVGDGRERLLTGDERLIFLNPTQTGGGQSDPRHYIWFRHITTGNGMVTKLGVFS